VLKKSLIGMLTAFILSLMLYCIVYIAVNVTMEFINVILGLLISCIYMFVNVRWLVNIEDNGRGDSVEYWIMFYSPLFLLPMSLFMFPMATQVSYVLGMMLIFLFNFLVRYFSD
jgi:hypothetical protein